MGGGSYCVTNSSDMIINLVTLPVHPSTKGNEFHYALLTALQKKIRIAACISGRPPHIVSLYLLIHFHSSFVIRLYGYTVIVIYKICLLFSRYQTQLSGNVGTLLMLKWCRRIVTSSQDPQLTAACLTLKPKSCSTFIDGL